MKQGTIRTLGVAAAGAVGAAMAVGAAGTAAAAPHEDVVGQTFAALAADTQTMAVEDALMSVPGALAQGADATQLALDAAQAEADAQAEAEAQAEPRAVTPAAAPAGQPNQLGQVGRLLGGVPLVGDLASGGVSGDALQGDLAGGGLLPTGGLPL